MEKRILMTEPKVLRRKSAREKPPKIEAQRGFQSKISHRQRSEAIGLIMVGISAFWFSLLYYLSKSKVANGVNWVTVQFGIGIFILPLLIGIMGIQRFLERPFTNTFLRVIGTTGTLVFGLGLLRFEGGKFGSAIFNFVSSNFGEIPSRLLLIFLTLSALIFALDILYKDLLIGCLNLAQFLAKFGSFLWESFLTFLALFLGAAKNTGVFATGIGAFALSFFKPGEPSEEEAEIHLLPFFKKKESSPSALPDQVSQVSSAGGERILTNEANLSPRHWREQPKDESKNSDDNLPCVDSPPSASMEIPPICSQQIIVNVESVSSLVSMTPTEEILVSPKTFSETSQAIPSSSSSSLDSDESFDVDEDDSKSPFPLDDHPIDKDLEKDVHASSKAVEKIPTPPAKLPPIDLLKVPNPQDRHFESDLQTRSSLLIKTLEDFGIKATISDVVEGPAVSRFEIKPAPGVKVSRITSLVDDIALALSAQAVRIEAPIPGKPALGIEIPNSKPRPVFLFDLVCNERFHSNETLLNLGLGVTISGRPVFADLSDMPHLLIAGATGSGKSVCINTIIASILFQARPDQVKMVMIDPKMVELSTYNGIPHLISPVVTDPKKASTALLWAVEEMERRYETLASCGVRKISTYNENLPQLKAEIDPELENMPIIVIIIDELADLMMTASAEVEGSICRLAQMARAVGIHLVVATQRPSVDVLTGIIKANLPSRIAFSVASHIDSRTILDMKGAERLLGKGDMLFVPKGRNKPLRLQGAFVSDRELQDLTEWVKSQGKAEYIEISPSNPGKEKENEEELVDEDDDTKLLSTIESYLLTQEKTSTSMLQRRFKIGYNRAARIMDILESKAFVSPLDGSNKRRVLGRRS